jgi:hypothetical protein
MRFVFVYGLVFLVNTFYFPQSIGNKSVTAKRANEKIVINGVLSEQSWKNAQKAVDFTEINPTEGKKPQFPTEVSILYDDYAIYVGAMLYDKFPDSILRQLGERDENLNADNFTVSFDTYNQKIDAFVFSVTASGVQSDSRFSDNSFNAVWNSSVKILDNGWSLEMEIPFSALRFANGDSLIWKVQFEREIRRSRSEVQWSLVSKDFTNPINYWGDLTGLTKIKNPIRLQLSPYLSGTFEENSGNKSYAYGGGADLKFGLSEAFTLDMTLLPDFSQVQSDNIIKNLSAFEVVFEEQRPFFQEGVDLFNRGGLFYSRRIGGVPMNYFRVNTQLDSNEYLISNPGSSRLINVSKISGRTQNGTGIGLLNALTAESYATAKNSTDQSERQILTNPMVNYNIFTIDQNLKNNSSIFFTNLNTTRYKGFRDANVSAAGFNFVNKSNSYSFAGTLKLTQREDTIDMNKVLNFDPLNDGLNYYLQFAKIKGAFRFLLASDNISQNYNPNDLGAFFRTNYRFHSAQARYNKYNPFWILNQLYTTLTYRMEQNFSTNEVLKNNVSFNAFTTLRKSFHSFFLDISSQLGDAIDLFESRVPGKIFVNQGFFFTGLGISSDYRRKLAIDGNLGLGYGDRLYGPSYYREGRLAPIIRLSDKFTLRPSIDFVNYDGGVGFGGYDSEGNPAYGQRNIFTLTNLISAKYLFRNNLSLMLRVRHYWSNGKYIYFGDLGDDGLITRNDAIKADLNFNFNAFNTDLVFAWQVAPGSFLNIVYKSALISDQTEIVRSYFTNIHSVFKDNPLNTITFKFIYFLDVASVKRK